MAADYINHGIFVVIKKNYEVLHVWNDDVVIWNDHPDIFLSEKRGVTRVSYLGFLTGSELFTHASIHVIASTCITYPWKNK